MGKTQIPGLLIIFVLSSFSALCQTESTPIRFRDYIKKHIPSQQEINVFLYQDSWVKFDKDVGYILGDFLPHDGIDNSVTISTVQDNGARRASMYKGKQCRINSYGNSFTAGNQVSDGETWQEYLAAHLGEPIRNFGVGGFGVYQSYRRMIREESSDHGAQYNILYIWGDDHFRSLLRSRYMVTTSWNERQDLKEGVGKMFHGNFWSNLEMDLEAGHFVEKYNLLPTPESLIKMTNVEWMFKHLQDDLALKMHLYLNQNIDTLNIDKLRRLQDLLDLNLDLSPGNHLRASIETLLEKYQYAATKYILLKAKKFTQDNNKKLLIVLFDPYGATRQLLTGTKRSDQEIVEFLRDNHFNYFDMNLRHVEDFQNFNLSIQEYYDRYFIGHYNPSGNHFFAYSIKDKIVEWLDPKPLPYLGVSGNSIDFRGYLKNYKSQE